MEKWQSLVQEQWSSQGTESIYARMFHYNDEQVHTARNERSTPSIDAE